MERQLATDVAVMWPPVSPKAALLMSGKPRSSSPMDTAFSRRRKRAGRWSAVRCAGSASMAMLVAPLVRVVGSVPSKSYTLRISSRPTPSPTSCGSKSGPARVWSRRVTGGVRGCAATGYQAVEYDNLDSYTRSGGLLTRRQATAYARLLVTRAHRAGLAAGQKNLAAWDGTRVGYDFAVAEECGRYDECGSYVAHYGDQVLMVEYRARDFDRTCAAYGATHAVVLRDRDLTPAGVHRWC